MVRTCARCGQGLAAGRLDRNRSRRMEVDRAAAGLVGVRFAYYRCPCGVDDVFIDVFPVAGEAPGTLAHRLRAMKEAARRVRVDGIETQVLLLGPPGGVREDSDVSDTAIIERATDTVCT